MMRKLYPDFVGGRGAWGLLAVRLMAGTALMLHGWGKIQNPFHWMDQMGAAPSIFQFLSAFTEFFGGLAVILGLLALPAALGIVFNFLVAIFMAHLSHGDPFVSPTGGKSWEPAAFYLVVGILMLLTGPGALSLDAMLFGKKQAVLTGSNLPQAG